MGTLNFLLRLLSHLARIIHMLSSHGADKLRPKDDDKKFCCFSSLIFAVELGRQKSLRI